MLEHRVSDWDNAYANSANIAGSDRWPALWIDAANAFRDARSAAGKARLDLPYGDRFRNRFDLFLPDAAPKGLVVFIHGGYWKAFDKSEWSHLAAGPLDNGYAVAMPTYTLCPDIRIAGIVREVGAAIEAAACMVDGPMMLTGHSAGGHLASRMICAEAPLSAATQARIRNVVSISGVHDLRPMMKTKMNEILGLDEAEAIGESPALLRPMENARITCWAGGGERHEFLRQNALLANIWTGLGATTACVVEPDRHHYSIVDGLADADHPLTRTLLG
ncbi:MAG: alpha/beta hydrolase [Rhizobiaceae bacterium]|nr:MAG: alpha/beta hydrolase [Rhizobiaceae bacterium]